MARALPLPRGRARGAPLRLLPLLALDRAELAAVERSHEWDFLCLPAVLALVDRSAPEPVASPYAPGPAPELPASVSIPTVQQLGVVLSRLWPTAWDAGRGDAEARARRRAQRAGAMPMEPCQY